MSDKSEIIKIKRKLIEVYIIAWLIVTVAFFGLEYRYNNTIDLLHLSNLSILILFPIYIQITSYPNNILFRKRIYLQLLGLLGLFLVIILIILSFLFSDVPLVLYSITLNFSIAFIFGSFLEVKIYNYFHSKHDLKRKKNMIAIPCPKCQKDNFYTYDKKEELHNMDLKCSNCGYDYSNQLYEAILTIDDLKELKEKGKYDKEIKMGF